MGPDAGCRYTEPIRSRRAFTLLEIIVVIIVAGMKGVDVSEVLLDKYKIYTAGVDNIEGAVVGARVTSHVFIQPKELDTLIGAITEIARNA